MTNLVYPGAQHTRFQHALGAMHLMSLAVETLRSKGHEITDDEATAVKAAILMHDIGHGPFSHVLEHTIVKSIDHERISEILMENMNREMDGALDLAIDIFRGTYYKRFLHQLISSQLDTDRLDYLKRDSFYTGVIEGSIGSDRIIKMLNMNNDELVVEAKGIYSIEKFLIARRLMYWQVYLHKTVISAEKMLIQILRRAKYLAQNGSQIFASPQLAYFIGQEIDNKSFEHLKTINNFTVLDDNDIISSIKVWMNHEDKILSTLSTCFINRNLFRIQIRTIPFGKAEKDEIKALVKEKFNLDDDNCDYFVFDGEVSNSTYDLDTDRINIMYSDNDIRDISEVSDIINTTTIRNTQKRYYLSYPKSIDNLLSNKFNHK